MRDFVPERICRVCYCVLTPDGRCSWCARPYEPWGTFRPYTIDALRWFTDARGERTYY